MPDDDGYPTEEELKEIIEWPHQDPLGWFEFIKSCWWSADWGWHQLEDHEIDIDEYAAVYQISTGGWSGNEEIIGAMKKNYILWTQSWEIAKRGGHFEFRVRRRNVQEGGQNQTGEDG